MNTWIFEKPGERWVVRLLEALEKGWKTYLAERKRCRLEFSNEAVHDLRVATRRMVAVIQLLNSIAPRPRLRKIIQTFKEQLDELDALRDTQVILAEISESIQTLPQLQAFQRQQRHLEGKFLKRLRTRIKNFQTKELTRRIGRVHESLESVSPEGFDSVVLQAVDDAYSFAIERLRQVNLERPSTIHRVRIAFKSFRYMVEILYPLVEAYPTQLLKSMHEYQSRMGEVQDAEVFLQTIMDYAENASFPDLKPVRHYFERRHAAAIAAFAEDMNHLHSFWRAAADQPFPWEMKT